MAKRPVHAPTQAIHRKGALALAHSVRTLAERTVQPPHTPMPQELSDGGVLESTPDAVYMTRIQDEYDVGPEDSAHDKNK